MSSKTELFEFLRDNLRIEIDSYRSGLVKVTLHLNNPDSGRSEQISYASTDLDIPQEPDHSYH